MIHVVLAGNYPAHTAERLQALLPQGQYRFSVADTQERYDGMTDAQVLILRVFRASKEVMDRNPGLNMIMRWGAGPPWGLWARRSGYSSGSGWRRWAWGWKTGWKTRWASFPAASARPLPC